ncbi:MAG: hypothetical protein US76_02220 [Parcubacteria group bacterium GW2011_GWA2_38_13b]|nr:MAG: hypothetical protein US76_02220 [Parcubacteria group bacterium GW2011_GWA2_38_13b]
MTKEIFFDNKIKALEQDSEEETKKAVMAAMEKCGNGPNGKKRKIFLDILRDTTETQVLVPRLKLHSMNLKKLPEILNHESIFELLSLMLEKKTLFRFQIGVLLSCFRHDELPEALLKKINPIKISENFTVEIGYMGWHLCEEAELRMRNSIKDKAVILANKGLLIKFNGRLSALCIKNFSSSGRGIFYEGNWYSPTDTVLREEIKKAFDDGDYSRIDLLSGNWALMRSSDLYTDNKNNCQQFLEIINKAVLMFSGFLPKSIEGMAKKDYRIKYEHKGDIVNPS